MNDQTSTVSPRLDADAMSDAAKTSFDMLSKNYVTFLLGANRLHAEAIRFVNERFEKDLQTLSQFSACRDPGEFLALQSEATTQLVNDYLQEGSRWMALLGEVTLQRAKASNGARG